MKKENKNIRQIQEWLLQGHLVTDIIRNIIEKWGLSEEHAIEYIASAFEDFTKKVNKGGWDKKGSQILQDLAKIEDIN